MAYNDLLDVFCIFWFLQSLATGRLATFSLPFVDCELPYDPDEKIADDGSIQPSCTSIFPLFIHSFTRSFFKFLHGKPASATNASRQWSKAR